MDAAHGAYNWSAMMPRDTSLSDGRTPHSCSNSTWDSGGKRGRRGKGREDAGRKGREGKGR